MKRFAAEIAAIKKRVKRLNVKARGTLAKTLSEWLSGHPLGPKLERQLAERWAAPDDPLEAQADTSPATGNEGGHQ